uniref:Ig-like domain-containing protein n=1 Tax=Periophthalmus magnuspinnatus TaxID=409849 RepID=A0A3B3ZB34_9GOBI
RYSRDFSVILVHFFSMFSFHTLCHFHFRLYAVLSCLYKTERDQNPRIEWKKRGRDVSFVYFDGQFRVPPHTPSCEIPTSAVTGSVVRLRCHDHQSIPPATYSWFKDSQPISSPRHGNDSYVLNSYTGVLEFKSVSKEDSGRYSCLASNGIGTPKMCEAKNMTIEDVNVTAVVVAVLVIGLIVAICSCGGVLLHRNGFFSRKLLLHSIIIL